MIFYYDKCVYYNLLVRFDWFDLTQPKYIQNRECRNCNGEKDSRPCFMTLDKLVEMNEDATKK